MALTVSLGQESDPRAHRRAHWRAIISSVTPSRAYPRPVIGLTLGVGLVIVVTLALLPFSHSISRATPALALVLPVVLGGVVGGTIAAIVTALAGGIAFSLGFIPPVGTLRVALSDDLVAQMVFIVVAMVVGTLVAREAEKRRAADQRAEQIESMHLRFQALVAEQQRLQAEADRLAVLEQVDQQRAALLRAVSHDLRTPLAAIRAVASDLRSGTDHPQATRDELLDLVWDESDRLDRLVANLLSLSRIEAGALAPHQQAVSPDELVADTVARLERLFVDVRLEVSLPPDLPLLDVDYLQMQQVLTNLVENAVRHSPPRGSVRVTAEDGEGIVALLVSDEGPGLGNADLAAIFEPFRTAAGSSSTGIGLAICKAIVDAHGGQISCRTRPEGGAEFRVELPRRTGA